MASSLHLKQPAQGLFPEAAPAPSKLPAASTASAFHALPSAPLIALSSERVLREQGLLYLLFCVLMS